MKHIRFLMILLAVVLWTAAAPICFADESTPGMDGSAESAAVQEAEEEQAAGSRQASQAGAVSAGNSAEGTASGGSAALMPGVFVTGIAVFAWLVIIIGAAAALASRNSKFKDLLKNYIAGIFGAEFAERDRLFDDKAGKISSELNERIKGVEDSLSRRLGNEADRNGANAAAADLEKRFSGEIDDVYSQVNGQFKELGLRFNSFEERLQECRNSLSYSSGRLEQLSGGLERICAEDRESVLTLKRSMDEENGRLESGIEEVRARISAAENFDKSILLLALPLLASHPEAGSRNAEDDSFPMTDMFNAVSAFKRCLDKRKHCEELLGQVAGLERELVLSRAVLEISGLDSGDLIASEHKETFSKGCRAVRDCFYASARKMFSHLLFDLLEHFRNGRAEECGEGMKSDLEIYSWLNSKVIPRFSSLGVIEGIFPGKGVRPDYELHKPVGTVSCEDASLRGTVAECRANGFRTSEKVFVKAEVLLFS